MSSKRIFSLNTLVFKLHIGFTFVADVCLEVDLMDDAVVDAKEVETPIPEFLSLLASLRKHMFAKVFFFFF